MKAADFFIPTLFLAASLHAEPTQAVRGLESRLVVDYAPRLRARADQSPTSAVLIRISQPTQPGQQRIEFIGTVAGSFDLRHFLEREDGQPIADLPPLPIAIVSNLPIDHGPDLYATSGSWMNWRAHYREIMWGVVALWGVAPIVVLTVRALRKPRAAPTAPPAPPPPTVADLLQTALTVARERPLTIEESGRLELLLLKYLGGDELSLGTHPATVLRGIRSRQETAPLVHAIERWLHAKDSGEPARAHAAAVLDELRRSAFAAAKAPEATV